MLTTTILLDWRPPYLQSGGLSNSLLLAPVGPRTLLEDLREQLGDFESDKLLVATNFEWSEEYCTRLRSVAPDAGVIPLGKLAELLEAHEPADRLLIVDARYAPLPALDVRRLFDDVSDCRLARHLVRVNWSEGGTQEHLQLDSLGRVRMIRRLYDGITRLETVGVVCSLLSVAFARRLSGMQPLFLDEVRTRLVSAGVPTRDFPMSASTLDLTEETDLLTLNERALHEKLIAGRSTFRALREGVWAAADVQIDPEARVLGPVLLHAGARVRGGAAIVGPAVIGAGAVVERDAVVTRSVLAAGASVSPGLYADRRVVASVLAADDPAAAPTAWRPQRFPMLQRTESPQHQSLSWSRRLYGASKRGVDVLVAGGALLLLSPLLGLVALLVRLTSRGPIFFGHEREGRYGRVFRCWKFRTMIQRAHALQREMLKENNVDGPQFKMRRDPRVTTIGAILRITNIDELPQLWNVLRGEMSLIGPRPSPFRENQICVPWREARLSVRPGITGLWQVCRHERSAGDFHQWIHYDVLYVRHRSIALDLRILLATFLTLGGRWGVPVSWMIPTERGVSREAQAIGGA